MTLTEKLLSSDEKVANTLKTGTFKSKRLARVLGESEPVEIQIKELAPGKISSMSADPASSNMGTYTRICLEGIVDPDLKNPEMLKHFGCSTPLSLTEKLFSLEVANIGEAIIKLSDVGAGEEEDEIKN